MRSLVLIALSSLALGACAEPMMMEKTSVKSGKMTIAQSRHVVKKPLAGMNAGDIAQSAATFKRYGHGTMYAVIGYDIHSQMQKQQAFAQAKTIAQELRNNGVSDDQMVVRAIPVSTVSPVAVLAFDKTEAGAPLGCQPTPGLDGPLADAPGAFDYELGCGVQGMMAKQLSNPMDLKGRIPAQPMTWDGQRLANVATTDYRAAETPRDYLPTYIISELAGSGN